MAETKTKNQEGQEYLQRWADMEVASVTEHEDGSVSLFLISLLGTGYHVHITAKRVGS